jgi:hypothetical protein
MTCVRSTKASLTMPIEELRLPMWVEMILHAEGIELVGQLISRTSAEVAGMQCMNAFGVELIEQKLASVGRLLRDRRLQLSQPRSDPRTAVIKQMPRKPLLRLEAIGIDSDSLLLDLSEQELSLLLRKKEAQRLKKSLSSQGLMLARRIRSKRCAHEACFGFCAQFCNSAQEVRRKARVVEYPSHVLESA